MERGLSADLLAFRQRVDTFIQAHWPSQAPTAEALPAWRQAVVEAGLSVPRWPESAGGTGWNPTQIYLWRQACAAAGIPLEQEVGVEIVGPLLLRYADAQQQARHLPGIRSLADTWAIAFAEPVAGIDYSAMQCQARPYTKGWRLDGEKCWVLHGHAAQWLLCFAYLRQACADADVSGSVGLFVIPTDVAGLTCLPQTSFDGSQHLASFALQDVRVPSDALVARSEDGAEFAHLFLTRDMSTLSQSAVARAQLDVLDQQLDQLDPQDALHAQRHAVAVALEALQAMELRYVDALQRQLEVPFPLDLLQLRSREILLKLGALQVESFGYYALPYPDEMLLHNEGSIGPDTAAATVRQNLAQHVAAMYEGSAEALKDTAWRELNSTRQ